MRPTSEIAEVYNLILLHLCFLLVVLDNRITRIKDHLSSSVDAKMVHKQAHGSALVEIGARFLEQGINRELQIELLDLERIK
jgi:hypothetical protein